MSLEGYFEIAEDLVPKLYNQSVETLVPHITVIASQPPDDFFWAGMIMVFSQRLVDTVKPFCHQAEFVPLKVQLEADAGNLEGYFLANVMEQVDCLDEKNGRYTYWNDGTVEKIQKLAIDTTAVAGHHLFWVRRAVPRLFCASQELQDAIRSAGHSGIGFRDPDNWNIINQWS